MGESVCLWCLIPFVIILLLMLPIVLEVRLSYNPLYNKGVMSFYLFGFCVFYTIISIKGNSLSLDNEKKHKQITLKLSGKKFEIVKQFFKLTIDKIKLKKLIVFYNVGVGDAYQNAMVCGSINQIIFQFFAFVKNEKPTASVQLFDNVAYNTESFELALRSQISLTIFDLIYSLAYATIKVNTHKVA